MAHGRHLVITLHGIRTFGGWQDRLRLLLENAEPGIHVLCYRYNYFSALAFLLPPARWLEVRHFRKYITKVCDDGSWTRIDIVAHSFGTHVAAWALYGLETHRRPRIHTMILSGSVLKSTFPWFELVP